MNRDGLSEKSAPSLESLHEVRLTALLHDLVEDMGPMKAAGMLGVNYKTLARSMESGRLSVHLREALMGMLLARGDAGPSGPGKGVEVLERRVEALAGEMRGGLEGLRREVEEGDRALGEELAQGMRQLERRLARLEARQDGTGPAGAGGGDGVLEPVARAAPRREYPDLVTVEPGEDDQELFGMAWPLVDEWRRLWEDHPNRGKSLSWLATEVRILELEVAMLERHGLTLPPETQPLRGFPRHGQLSWRKTALEETRRTWTRRRLMRRVRRALTLGLWRN